MEKLVYENAVEGLFIKGFGKQLTPTLKAAMKEVGIGLMRLSGYETSPTLKPRYPNFVHESGSGIGDGDGFGEPVTAVWTRIGVPLWFCRQYVPLHPLIQSVPWGYSVSPEASP